MSTEWTVDTLKEHLETLMENRFKAQEEGQRKFTQELEAKDLKNNEFRGQLSDQAAKFPTREEMEAKLSALSEKIDSKNIQIMLSLGIGFTGVLIAVFNFASAH